MAERIQRLSMQAFRGVPTTLDIELGGRSLVLYGENGTGKSTVADALEWYFTRRIELLSHEGREHAIRHLGAEPDTATSVTVETTGELGGAITHPARDNSRARQVGSRETFILRGRTLADFINKPKAKKWQALAEILGLEAVDQLRLDLQRARNDLRAAATDEAARLADVEEPLRRVVPDLSEANLLTALKDRCVRAGLLPPGSIEEACSGSWEPAIREPEDGGVATRRAIGIQKLTDELRAPLRLRAPDSSVADWNDQVAAEDKQLSVRLGLLRAADRYLEADGQIDQCPLCGTPVDPTDLAERVRALLQELEGEHDAARRAEDGLGEVIQAVESAERRGVAQHAEARRLGIELPSLPQSPSPALRAALETREPARRQAITAYADALEGWGRQAIAALDAEAPVPVDPREALLIEIGALSEQARNWRSAKGKAAQADRAYRLAEAVFSSYQRRQRAHLDAVLRQISSKTAELYARLHPGEGLDGVGIETWSEKGVELTVEFHGSHQRPPHGVLSESHLNSLAIALFLAMAETFNRRLGFLVLDDIVNSFDEGHRATLADLLARDFPHRQLIVLTHDHLFFMRLTRLAQDWRRLEFTSCDYAEGPRRAGYSTGQLSDAARGCLESGDLHGAAAKIRRALEELLQEVCEGLRMPLPFRRGAGNDRREAQELLDGVARGLRDQCKPFYRELQPLLQAIGLDTQATLNVEVHAGRDRATRGEIVAALERIERFDALWSCAQCGTRVWRLGTPEAASCRCRAKRFPPREGEWQQVAAGA
jgi:RecF/RecN/SMC N terminal domain